MKLRVPRRQLITIAVVIGVAWMAFVLVGRGSFSDDAASDDAASDGGSQRETTTTRAAVAFDFPAHCEALELFTTAAVSLGPDQPPSKLVTGLEVVSGALKDLGSARDHPDLVEQVEILRPVVNAALQEVRAASPEELASIAADPRFADPKLTAASTAIMAYPLRCPDRN